MDLYECKTWIYLKFYLKRLLKLFKNFHLITRSSLTHYFTKAYAYIMLLLKQKYIYTQKVIWYKKKNCDREKESKLISSLRDSIHWEKIRIVFTRSILLKHSNRDIWVKLHLYKILSEKILTQGRRNSPLGSLSKM